MSDVWVGRFNRWLEKLLGAKGGPVLVDLNPSVQPVFSPGTLVEELYLQGWNRFIASANVGAVAAQFGRFGLRNPSGSNVVAVVESIWFNATGLDYEMTTGQPDFANVQTGFLRRLDARSGVSGSVCFVSTDTNATRDAGAAAVVMRRATVGEVFQDPAQFWTLLPNDMLWIATDLVNTPLQANLQWRERVLETSELT